MKKVLLICCSLALVVALQAQIIRVPADYPTIQKGINAATPGDTVLVSEGTYYEQIKFKGKKPLLVASKFIKDGDTSHISKTIIDGSQLTNKDSASVVYFISGEDTTSILCGFTIRGGKGTIWKPSDLSLFLLEGGGIYIYNSGGTIRNNIITANSLDDHDFIGSSGVEGGGIMIDCYFEPHWSIIENNEISDNWVTSSNTNSGGGGVCAYGNIRIQKNLIKRNSCIQTSTDHAVYLYGGGLYYGSPEDPVTELILRDNIFEKNSAIGIDGCGAGAGMDYGKITCTGNTFSGNEIVNSDALGGGGMICEFLYEGSVFTNNIFRNNKSAQLGGGIKFNMTSNSSVILVENNYFFNNVAVKGGAIGAYNVPLKLQNNVFSGNQATGKGGAIYLERAYIPTVHLATLINNSFSRNKAGYGGAIASTDSKPLIINSVFWGDSAGYGREIYLSFNDKVEIANSTINPSYITGIFIDSGGNLNSDPMFADADSLKLDSLSSCRDRGTVSFTCECGVKHCCPMLDIKGVSRPNGSGIDIGAHEFIKAPVGIEELPHRNPDFGITNYPNPFTESTTFTYRLNESSLINLQVFNNLGVLVAEPINEFQKNGEQKVIWNAEGKPAGIYYSKLQVGGQTNSVKIVKIK